MSIRSIQLAFSSDLFQFKWLHVYVLFTLYNMGYVRVPLRYLDISTVIFSFTGLQQLQRLSKFSLNFLFYLKDALVFVYHIIIFHQQLFLLFFDIVVINFFLNSFQNVHVFTSLFYFHKYFLILTLYG